MTGVPDEPPAEEQDNRVAADRIAGDIVQARDVHGGVYFGADPRQPPPFSVVPRQLPGDVRAFVNRDRELAELGDITGLEPADPAPVEPVEASAVVVITGSAGVGKTALVNPPSSPSGLTCAFAGRIGPSGAVVSSALGR